MGLPWALGGWSPRTPALFADTPTTIWGLENFPSLEQRLALQRYIRCSVLSDSLRPNGLFPTRLLCRWNSPGKNTGVGGHSLLQGIFPTQGSISGLLHGRQILYRLSHQGSPDT